MVVSAIAAWAALDESIAGAATRRLAHHEPVHHPGPTHPVGDRHGDPFCATAFFGQPMGSLQKSTSAGPDQSSVVPGQQVTVTLTWNPRDFGGHGPTIVEDCVKIGSRVSTSLSQDHRPGPAGGTDTFKYAIPVGGTNGQEVCDRGVAVSSDPWWGQHGQGWGQDGDDDDPYRGWRVETSPVLCYTLLAAAAPEAPQALVIPVAGLVVGGSGYWLARRRRRPRGLHAAGRAGRAGR